MDDILVSLQDLLEGQIDFHGQRTAEILHTALLVLSGAVAFVVGYLYEDIFLTLCIGLAGTVLTALVVIPPWPIFNKHPEKWFSPAGAKAGGTRILVDGVKVG
ncbi:hypothetical protein VTN02DRAFT_1744 [Thermoascus thermophilus]